MARRRLQAILATTVITTGLTVAPAMALPGLDDVTEPLEEVVEPVTDALEPVEDVVSEVVEPVESAAEPVTDVVAPVLERPAAEEDPPPPPIEVGTGDGTLDVAADVDLGPSDADGSPEFEVDARITVLGTTIDLGEATDPVEDAIDPDPEPTTPPADGDESSHGPVLSPPRITGPGGLQVGGGVEPSGGEVRTVGDTTGRDAGAPAATPAVFRPGAGTTAGAGGQGSQGSLGGSTGGSATTVPDVATPGDGADSVEDPAVMASEGGPVDTTETSALLRILATAMVLGTAGIWFRATRQAGGGTRFA